MKYRYTIEQLKDLVEYISRIQTSMFLNRGEEYDEAYYALSVASTILQLRYYSSLFLQEDLKKEIEKAPDDPSKNTQIYALYEILFGEDANLPLYIDHILNRSVKSRKSTKPFATGTVGSCT